jgi:eukaryotic translation initiation factor 2C
VQVALHSQTPRQGTRYIELIIGKVIPYANAVAELKTYTIKDFLFDATLGPDGAHAKNFTFPMRDKNNPNAEPRDISIFEYFKKTYNITLQFPSLPLVKTEKDGTFPMEVCILAENQQYKYKTSPDQVSLSFNLILNL